MTQLTWLLAWCIRVMSLYMHVYVLCLYIVASSASEQDIDYHLDMCQHSSFVSNKLLILRTCSLCKNSWFSHFTRRSGCASMLTVVYVGVQTLQLPVMGNKTLNFTLQSFMIFPYCCTPYLMDFGLRAFHETVTGVELIMKTCPKEEHVPIQRNVSQFGVEASRK